MGERKVSIRWFDSFRSRFNRRDRLICRCLCGKPRVRDGISQLHTSGFAFFQFNNGCAICLGNISANHAGNVCKCGPHFGYTAASDQPINI